MLLTQILQKIRSAFYTKSETDTKLSGKSNTNHNHNSAYLGIKAKAESAKSADSVAWGGVSGKPSTFTPSSHTHDDRYYTESEVNNLLSGKANSSHTHSYIPTSASCNKNWNWSEQGGQPSWLWGGEDGTNMYVYNPSNFSVKYANSSGNADTVDGSHAWQMQTLSAGGRSHGSVNWLMQCQHNVDGDKLFKLYVGDKSIGTKVDRAGSAGYADYAARSANNGAFYISGYQIYVG